MGYNITFIGGSAGKMEPDEVLDEHDLCEGQIPRFGYYWWYWLPSPSYNGGNPIKHEVMDLTVNWLRFWFAITAWPTKP